MEAIKRKHEVMRALFQPCNHVVFVHLLCSFYLCQGGYVIVGVCLLAVSRKNYSSSCHKIWWKGGTWPTEDHFDGNSNRITLGGQGGLG